MTDHADFEAHYWGDCTNTINEDIKHYVYARSMGIRGSAWTFDAPAARIIDIGGGPTSMLLKCQGLAQGLVVDPLPYPAWTRDRYATRNIQVQQAPGEHLAETGWDEVWIYNVLQHTEDPELIIALAQRAAPRLRIFEWIDIPAHPGHPWMLTATLLESWTGQAGVIEEHTGQNECYGRSWSAVVQWRDI